MPLQEPNSCPCLFILRPLRLAPITGELKFATVAGSHMNQVCRLWHAHMKHPSPLLTDGQGRLSLEKLCNEDPEYHRAVSQGMEWQIISHLVPKEIPEFCLGYTARVSVCFVFSSGLTPNGRPNAIVSHAG